MRVGFIAARGHDTTWARGQVDRAWGRLLQWLVRARPVRQGIEHVAAIGLVIFKHQLAHDLLITIQYPCTRYLPCRLPFVSHAVLEWI
jgi:hypothetical protein